jgi:two-component system, LytTR family, response regulator LytT
MNAVIIEDEKLVAKDLIMEIAEIDPHLKVLEILPSIKKALKWFAEYPEPDVVFADIQLADGVSFEIFEKYPLTCPIIFITSYNEFAIRAFKVNGIDYLLKPVESFELKKAIDKAKKINKNIANPAVNLKLLVEMLKSGETTKSSFKEHFLCNHRNAWVPIKVDDIAYLLFDKLIYLFTKTNEKYSFDSDSMDEVELMLDSNKFFRANRQFIVNRESIQRIWGIENSKMLVKLKEPYQGTEIDLSRQKSPIFKRWLEK